MKERFKAIRNHYGLSQAEFAQRIHMSPGFISNVETGRSNISEKTIQVVCEAFSINREWLMTGEGEMFTGTGSRYPVDREGLASRVRKVREWTGLSQEVFGKRIGYSKIQIHAVEKGKVFPSNQYLEKIINEFHISSQWVYTGEGLMEEQEIGLDDQLIQWLREHPEVIRELRIRSGLST